MKEGKCKLTTFISKFDLTLILLVPIVLVIFFLLPSNLKGIFILEYSSPLSPGIYFTHFVHKMLDHLLGNLAVYFVYAFVTLIIATAGKIKKEFYWVFGSFLLLLPFVVSALNILIVSYYNLSIGRSLGFSAINSAFMGVFSFFVASLIKELEPKIDTTHIVLSMLFFVFGLEAMIYAPFSPVYLVIWPILIFYLWNSIKVLDLRKTLKRPVSMKDKRFLAFVLICLSFFIYFSGVIGLFPSNIQITKGVNVDIIAHYVGLTLGFGVSLVLSYRQDRTIVTKSKLD